MRRREFVSLASCALAASSPIVPLPQFPTMAHQLVWRNWDLVPAGRIARALSCNVATVHRLAQSMGLPSQAVDERFAPRQRFQILRRNWTFVPMEQLTVVAGMTTAEITSLLGEDAFYNGHLGPKPDVPRIRIEASPPPKLDYSMPHTASPIPRFEFADGLLRDIPALDDTARHAALDPRIAFPYTAVYGDVLGQANIDAIYPDVALRALRHQGLNGIWLHAMLRDLTSHPLLPGFGSQRVTRLGRLNRLIGRCDSHGLKVYLYLNEPRAMPASFFDTRPELRGDIGRNGDGLVSLCTSTEPVRLWLREAVGQLLAKAPGLAGVILITASENPTNCYSIRRNTACPRCSKRTPDSVIGEVVRLIREGAHQASPAAKIIAWDWSWGMVEDDPQRAVIAALPDGVTLQVDFERGTPAERLGRKTLIDEYSLSVPGPSPRAQKHIAQAKQRGMPVMAKVQIGNSWELGLLPFIPVPDLIANKCAALRHAGVDGAMLSWTLGTWPDANWAVARRYFNKQVPDKDEVLDAVARERYGPASVAAARKAWSTFSRAFAEYPYSNRLVYSSPVQQGPAHPIWLQPSGQQPRILNSFDDLGWTEPYGPAAVARSFRDMAQQWAVGIKAFAGIVDSSGRAAADQRIHRACQLYFASIANQVEIHMLRSKPEEGARLRNLVGSELRIAEEFLPLCEGDPRIGFEPSLQYFYLPLDVREKILWCRAVLKSAL